MHKYTNTQIHKIQKYIFFLNTQIHTTLDVVLSKSSRCQTTWPTTKISHVTYTCTCRTLLEIFSGNL